MTEPVRRAGTGHLADGRVVTWTIATGRHGRRWREVIVDDDAVVSSLLLETDPERRFSHLELATSAGLLTLHPEGDATLHGNAVTAAAEAVRHVSGLPWGADDVVVLADSVIGAAAIAWACAERLAIGDTTEIGAVRITADLWVERVELHVARQRDDGWRLETAGAATDLQVDDDGLPVLARARIWQLELD